MFDVEPDGLPRLVGILPRQSGEQDADLADMLNQFNRRTVVHRPLEPKQRTVAVVNAFQIERQGLAEVDEASTNFMLCIEVHLEFGDPLHDYPVDFTRPVRVGWRWFMVRKR